MDPDRERQRFEPVQETHQAARAPSIRRGGWVPKSTLKLKVNELCVAIVEDHEEQQQTGVGDRPEDIDVRARPRQRLLRELFGASDTLLQDRLDRAKDARK